MGALDQFVVELAEVDSLEEAFEAYLLNLAARHHELLFLFLVLDPEFDFSLLLFLGVLDHAVLHFLWTVYLDAAVI